MNGFNDVIPYKVEGGSRSDGRRNIAVTVLVCAKAGVFATVIVCAKGGVFRNCKTVYVCAFARFFEACHSRTCMPA